MRFYFLIIGFLFITFKSNSQYNFLYNDSIKYQIGFKTRSIDPNSKSGYFIVISIPEETREKLKKEKINFWLPYLTNEKTDWATNLVLYAIFKKDAYLIKYFYTDRKRWLTAKNEEIEYWKEHIK